MALQRIAALYAIIASNMKKKNKLTKISLVIAVLIIFLSVIVMISSFLSEKKSSFGHTGFGKMMQIKGSRKFTIESEEEHIYNLGEYQVNLTRDKHLLLNLSVRSAEDSFEKLLENKIVVQNAVIEAFSTYGGIAMPTTAAGKNSIKNKIMQNINESPASPMIEEVYFNKFIIQ